MEVILKNIWKLQWKRCTDNEIKFITLLQEKILCDQEAQQLKELILFYCKW